MSSSIVTVNVTQQVAPSPLTLQQRGAILSLGGTNTAAGTKSLLTSAADLTALLPAAKALTSLAWSGGIVTATTTAAHGIPTSTVLDLTIAGATPAGYNGTFECTITGANTFTYALANNPGLETVPGTYTPADVAELTSQVNTFFAQGSQQAIYVLELGIGSAADGVAYLDTWITDNPDVFYSYLTPRNWADESTFLTFLAQFEALTSKTYFFVTMTADNYTTFTDLMKCVVPLIEAPTKPSTEFSHASDHWVSLHYRPSSTNKVTPFAYSYLFGVTAYPLIGNAPLIDTFQEDFINIVGTGAEGGISNTILNWGTTKDGRDFTYWYSVDYCQINGAQALANAVINGSNNSANPLYYNQNGIDRLQSVLAGVMNTAISVGLALGSVVQTSLSASDFTQALESGQFDGLIVVNAIPFTTYLAEHPSDYKVGNYAGLSVSYTPSRGFKSIVFNLNVSDFVTQ